MDIIKFTKKKNGFYELLLENDSKLLIHEDLILKYDLLLYKKLESELKDKLLKENELYLIYNNAIKYITLKMRSAFEIENYLLKQKFDKEDINRVIDKLIMQGYINDKEFCKAYILDRINLSNDGPNKIVDVLRKNKINDTFIEEFIDLFDENLQREKINKIILKQIKLNTNKGSYLLKQKIINYLVNLGYDRTLVLMCLENVEFNNKDLYKKEYEKLYEKLSKKYSGKELEYKIKQRLYQKGFTNN